MGLLGRIGKIIIGGALGGPAGAISVFTVQDGERLVKGAIDVARQVVRLGTDVYRAIPPEAFVLAGDPIHGILKHEAEDELIFLGQIAGDAAIFAGVTWPAVGIFGVVPHLYVTGKLLLGKVHHRPMNDEEWEMARYIFRDSLPDRADIILTNLAGQGGRPFTYPMAPLGVPIVVNLGGDYDPQLPTPNGPLLFHELTHVWQAKQRVLREIFFYDALPDAVNKEYEFTPDGRQWSEYGTEQQATIVEAWTLGATKRPFDASIVPRPDRPRKARGELTIGTPLFRYVNGNIRRGDESATTSDGRSARQLLNEGGHGAMREMHSRPPAIWW